MQPLGYGWSDVNLADNTDTNLEADAPLMVALAKSMCSKLRKTTLQAKMWVSWLTTWQLWASPMVLLCVCSEALTSAKDQYAHWQKIWKDLKLQFWDSKHRY